MNYQEPGEVLIEYQVREGPDKLTAGVTEPLEEDLLLA